MVGNPPTVRLKEIVSAEGLINCPVEFNDVTNYSTIFGPNRNILRGASTTQKPKKVREEYMKTPGDFYRLHKFVNLESDVMFVNSIHFLVNFSRSIRLITVEHVPTRTRAQLAKSLMNIVKLYARGGFVIHLVLMDTEFEKIKDKVGLVEVNITAAREHVGEIERHVRLIK